MTFRPIPPASPGTVDMRRCRERAKQPNSTLSVDVEKARAWKKRGKPLKRGKPMRWKNAARAKKRAEKGEVYGPYWRWVNTLPCLLAGQQRQPCVGYVVGHHLKRVATGGKDAGNLVPLCVRHHRSVHAMGEVRFNDRWGLDVYRTARELDAA